MTDLDRVLRSASLVAVSLLLGAGLTGTASAQAQSQPVARDSLLASESEYQGWKWWHVYCYRCHGPEAIGGSLAPDLRHSVSAEGLMTLELFLTTVRDGRLEKAMPSWKQLLSDEQIRQLYDYVKARSDGRLAPGRPHRKTDQP